MTTVILLGEDISIKNTHNATADLVEFHVIATQSRFQHQMDELIANPQPVTLVEADGFQHYLATIKNLDDQYEYWSIRDDRVLLFLDEFAGLVRDPKLLWLDTERVATDYAKSAQKLNRQVFDQFTGPKLKLEKTSQNAIKAFIEGKPVAAKPAAKKRTGRRKKTV